MLAKIKDDTEPRLVEGVGPGAVVGVLLSSVEVGGLFEGASSEGESSLSGCDEDMQLPRKS